MATMPEKYIKQLKLGDTNYELIAGFLNDGKGGAKDWADVEALVTAGFTIEAPWTKTDYESTTAPTAAKLATVPAVTVYYNNGKSSATGTLAASTAETRKHIYLIYHPHSGKDNFDEYVSTGTDWEKIGNTDIDLSDYVKKGTYAGTASSAGAHTHDVTATGTLNTVEIESKKLSISRTTDAAVSASSTKNALGENATFTTVVTPITKYIKGTASGTGVSPDGTANAITGFGTHSTKSALGENATFTTTVTPTKTKVKATAAGTQVEADGTANAITGFGDHTTDNALGENATFTTTVTPSTKGVQATASGTEVQVKTTDAVLGKDTQFSVSGGQLTGATPASKVADTWTANTPTTPAVIDVTKFNGGALASDGSVSGGVYSGATQASFTQGTFSQGTLPSYTQGSKASWSASVDANGVLSFSFSANGDDTWSAGSLPSHAEDQFTANNIGSVSAITYTAPTLTPASLGTGFYTAGTKGTAASFTEGAFTPNAVGSVTAVSVAAITSGTGSDIVNAATDVEVKTQPSIALSDAASGGYQVVSGITSASTTVATKDTVAAITALGTPTTAAALTGVKVKTQPTITLATGAAEAAGVIEVATGITSATTAPDLKDSVAAITALGTPTTASALTGVKITSEPTIAIEAIDTSVAGSAEAVTGISSVTTSVNAKDVVASITGVSVSTQPVFDLNGSATDGINYAALTETTSTETVSVTGTAASAGAHEHTTSTTL